MKNILFILLPIILLLSCDEPDEVKFFFVGEDEYLFIDSTIKQNDFSVILYQYDTEERNLIAGYNNLELGFYDYKSRSYASDVSYEMEVFKITGSDTVFAPYFAGQTFNSLKLANSPIYFTEESGTDEWILKIEGKINGRDFESEMRFDDVEFGIYQDEFEYLGESYLISLVEPINPQTGVIPLELAIHKKIDKKYEPSENFTTDVRLFNEDVTNPPGIVNPIPAELLPGHYRGVINLTDRGDWILEIDLFLNGEIAHTYQREIFIKVTG